MLITDRLPELQEKEGYTNCVLALYTDEIYCESNLYIPKWTVSNVAYYIKHSDEFEGWIDLEMFLPKIASRIASKETETPINLCLGKCLEQGWYDPKTHICSWGACEECQYVPGSCDGVCNPPECREGYSAFPHTWNPEIRIEIDHKIVKLAELDSEQLAELDSKQLNNYLQSQGFNDEDALKAAEAYIKGGIEMAVDTFRWADDSKHDYSGELKDTILEWINISISENTRKENK